MNTLTLEETLTVFATDPSVWDELVTVTLPLLGPIVDTAASKHLKRWSGPAGSKRWGPHSEDDLRQQLWENALIALREAAHSWDGRTDPHQHITAHVTVRTRTVDYETMGRYTRTAEVRALAARQIREGHVSDDLASTVRAEIIDRYMTKGMTEQDARARLVKDGYEAAIRDGAAALTASAPLSLDRGYGTDEGTTSFDVPEPSLADGTGDGWLPEAATLELMSRFAFGSSDTDATVLVDVLDGSTSREARRQATIAAARMRSPHCQWAHLACVRSQYEHPVQHRRAVDAIRSRKRRNAVAGTVRAGTVPGSTPA